MNFFQFTDGSIINLAKVVKVIQVAGYWTVYFENQTWTMIDDGQKKELDTYMEGL